MEKNGGIEMTDEIVGSCRVCGLGFTQTDYDNAAKGIVGDKCLVGDEDDICYPCELKTENGFRSDEESK